MPEADRVTLLSSLIGRIVRLADAVARRSRRMGWIGIGAAPIAWLTLFGRWAFDSAGRFVFFIAVLALLLAPGAILLIFARLLHATVADSDEALAGLGELFTGTGEELGGGVARMAAKPGLRALGSLLGSLWKLRSFRADFGSALAGVLGSARLMNPVFLLWVGAAALGVGLVLALAVGGLVVAAL